MTHTYEEALQSAASELRAARRQLLNEIAAYPTPISGCDEHFNRLLSDRTRLSKAIHALEDRPFVPTPRVLEPGTPVESR